MALATFNESVDIHLYVEIANLLLLMSGFAFKNARACESVKSIYL